MEATRDDIEGLFELQRIDLEIKRLSKELDELPQRGIIVAARDKKTAIEAKSEQVAELKRATTKKITRIDDEDASLAKKEAGVQAAIDAAHGDFRNVEARTKELAGIVRRRATIAEDRAAVAAELDKISTLGCILMDTTDKRMWVCKGTPCCSPFREYTWQRPDKLAQWQDIVLW